MNNNQVGFISGMQGWFNIRKSIYTICHINKSKGKMFLSIDLRKPLTKFNTPFAMMKTLKKIKIEECFLIFLNVDAVVLKPIPYSMVNTRGIFPKTRNKARMPTIPTTIHQHYTGGISLCKTNLLQA